MFLTAEEMFTHIYAEVVEAISQDNEQHIQEAIKSAIGEAKGYLSRYDTTALMGKTADERDPILLMYLKDMTVWHFIVLSNPGIELDFREKRYNAAVSWLMKVQAGKVVPEGWALREPETRQSYVQYGSNPRRSNHY